MNGNRRNKLKVTYYSSFLIFVVIPILCITIVSIAIVKRMMLHSAMDKIELAQKNVERILTEEINSISLRLAHLVHANNNEVLSLAARTDTEDIEDNGKGITEERIEEIFHPKEDNEDNYNIGISNVYNRLKLNYGDLCEMKIESQIGYYTKTTIKIPIKGLHNEEREHV